MSKTVFITGTSTGFGKLTALTLASAGYTVVAGMRGTKGRNKAAADELASIPNIEVVDIDVTDDASVTTAFKKTLAKHGKIDVLVNNAAVTGFGLLEAYSLDKIRQIFEVNFYGVVRTYQAVLPSMRKEKGGLIINITSGASGHTLPFMVPYLASKFGVESITEGLQDELRQFNIENISIQPGVYPTEMNNGVKTGVHADKPAIAKEYDPIATEQFNAVGAGLFGKMAEFKMNPQTIADGILELVQMKSGTRPLRFPLDAIAQGTDVEFISARAEIKARWRAKYAMKTIIIFLMALGSFFQLHAQTIGVQGLDHVGINVPDMDSALVFFTETMGFEKVTEIGPLPLDDAWKKRFRIRKDATVEKIVMLRTGNGSNLELFQYKSPERELRQPFGDDVSWYHLGFYTDNIPKTVAYLKGKGVKFLSDPITVTTGPIAGETWVYFETPWGLQIELVSYPNGKAYEKENPKVVLWSPKEKPTSEAPSIKEEKINKYKTAKDLMIEYLNNIQHPEKVAELFTEDGAIELPYFKSVGIPPRSVGKQQITAFISELLRQAPDYKFININILMETPEQVFAEYEVNTLFNGKPYKQLYMGRLVARNGKIVLIREACDTVLIEQLKRL